MLENTEDDSDLSMTENAAPTRHPTLESRSTTRQIPSGESEGPEESSIQIWFGCPRTRKVVESDE